MPKPRPRHVLIFGGGLMVMAALLLTDPGLGWLKGLPIGGALVAYLLGAASGIFIVGLTHLTRKGLGDYPEADLQTLNRVAAGSPTGAGLAMVAWAIFFLAISGIFTRAANAQGLPAQALQHLPTLRAEIRSHWPDHPAPRYFGGLIEHESCVSLTHARCWSAASRLRTQREEGAGLGQITRTWRLDGSERFDALREMRDRHPALAEWSWANVYTRADLQMRGVVLKSRDDWGRLGSIEDAAQRLAMTDAAYNAGVGRVHADRRACGLRAECDPQQWWGHVETSCTASTAPLYGQRSPCDINRHHVRDVIKHRMPKYADALG